MKRNLLRLHLKDAIGFSPEYIEWLIEGTFKYWRLTHQRQQSNRPTIGTSIT